jgi:hypothetical protein
MSVCAAEPTTSEHAQWCVCVCVCVCVCECGCTRTQCWREFCPPRLALQRPPPPPPSLPPDPFHPQKYVCREERGDLQGVHSAHVERIVSTSTNSSGHRSTSVTYKVLLHHREGHYHLTKSSTNMGECV